MKSTSLVVMVLGWVQAARAGNLRPSQQLAVGIAHLHKARALVAGVQAGQNGGGVGQNAGDGEIHYALAATAADPADIKSALEAIDQLMKQNAGQPAGPGQNAGQHVHGADPLAGQHGQTGDAGDTDHAGHAGHAGRAGQNQQAAAVEQHNAGGSALAATAADGGFGDIKSALEAINTSIDIFNKISDIVIDKAALAQATEFITEKRREMIEYGSETVDLTLQQLAECGVTQSQTAQRIKTMARTLLMNINTTQMLFNKVNTSSTTSKLDESSRRMLGASLDVLAKSLGMAVTQAEAAVNSFEGLERQAAKLQATLLSASLHFAAEQDESSKTITDAISTIRKQAYISCALMTPVPALAIACAAAAAAIVEGAKVPELQQKLQDFSTMMDGFQKSFALFADVAKGYQSTAQNTVVALDQWIAVAVQSEIFVGSTQDVEIALLLISELNSTLDQIASVTRALIDKIPAA